MALAKPTQITVPFSSNGVKNTIPETATGSNLASMQEGFPVITMTDVDQGGMPPQGQDMNGILFDVTTAIRYQQAGGLFPFDATFAQTVDGYPLGALLTAADGSCLYQNTVSGNVSDPENGGQGWSQILSSASIAGKQDKLTPVQMDAVNSGITSARVAIYDSYANGKQDALTFDNTPTNGSSNPVTSDGIYTALGTKQDTITFDATPQSGSTNPVQSGGVYDALSEKVDIDNAGDAEVIATGSTESRTLADRFADCVNVKDFGAVGNNSTDDTAAIQAAIDTGKDVYFPCINNEQYKVTSTLETHREGQSFFSDPQANTGILFYTTGTSTPLFNVKHQLVRFTNLHIRSNSNGTGVGIYASAPDVVPGKPFVNNTDLTVHECDISNFYVGIDTNGRGPKVYGTVFGEVHDPIKINWTDESTAEATASDTDKILYGNDYGFRGTVINDNVFHVCHGVCINFVSGNPNGAIISGNRFDIGVGRFLVCAGKLQGATITNNALMYSGTTFIESPQIERCSIVGNTFRGTTVQSSGAADRYPTRFILSNTSSKHNTISGNTFECSQLDSIYLQNSYYDTITGNTFLNCAGDSTSSSFQGAIFLRTTAEGTVIDGNTCVLPNEYALFVHVNTSTTLKNVKITDNSVSDESRLLYTPNFSDLGGNEIGNNGLLVTATGSSTPRTLADWMKFVQEPKTGRKKIVFTADFKCPDYDELMSKTYQQGATNNYIWPQAINRFKKGNTEYLFVLLSPEFSVAGTGAITKIVIVYNLNTGAYLGYWLVPDVPTTEGIVVKTESDGDYIYLNKTGNTLQKFKFTLGTYKTTLTGIDVVDPDGNPVPVVWFLSYLNGTWCAESQSNRIGGFSSRTLFFYDDNFKRLGQFDVQKYEQDVWNAYEGLTAEQQKIQWSIPRTQAISIGTDGIYFYKGGGTNAADTTSPITDCGVDHYNFQGDLVRSSVCRHTPFANKLFPLLGVTSAINHTECEGGYCTDDGRCFWFAVAGGRTGKIVLMEEFSDSADAVDFSDCLANRQSNIPFQSNRPSFPHGSSSKIENPWTGELITSVDEFIKMCAVWGLDDVYVSNYSGGLGTKIANVSISSSENYSLHIRRYNYNRYFVEVFFNTLSLPSIYVVGLDNNFNVVTCYIQRNDLYALTLSSASFSPSTDGGASLGTASLKWSEVFSNTATINTSDERLKDNISDIDDAVLDAWELVSLKVFQFKDAIERKGDDARIHTGVIAQQVQRAFESKGLDAFRYGLLCYDAWEAKDAVLDEDGNEIEPAQEAGDRYSIRYEEALILEAAYQRRRADRIESRLLALEERMG